MIAGKMMLVRGMEWNADIYIVKPSADPFSEDSFSARFDFVAMVPLQVETCLANPASLERLKKTNTLLIGGAGLSPALFENIKKHKLNAYQSFGMTEMVSHFALAKIEGENLEYHALPGVKVGADDSGKLWIMAPMAIEPLLQTNDLVEIIAENTFVWKGRADFTINSGGIKIQPEILESKIQPYIQSLLGNISFIVGAKDDARLGHKAVLVLQAPQISKSQTESLLKLLHEKVPRFEVPKEIHCLSEFEKTSSGKINRIKTLEKIL
jgi:O-succinylbenzoic acid--CoA ligase